MTDLSMPAQRDPALVRRLADKINQVASGVANRLGRPLQIMEVCGGHTHALFHSGIDQLLSADVEFVHGPGCPVCVLPPEAIDQAVGLAGQPDTMLVTFGDVLRVPGSSTTLAGLQARGADIRVVYSPMDVIALARAHPEKNVIFLAIGFDTTMPAVALTIEQAARDQVNNLRFLCYHIRLIPTLQALLERKDVVIDGFIGPGHVSMIIGKDAYEPLVRAWHTPLVVAGFEPVDMMRALWMVVVQLDEQRCQVENAYERVVTDAGNVRGLDAIRRVFAADDVTWRGVGRIPGSVRSLNASYAALDASRMAGLQTPAEHDEPVYCADVLTGKRKPTACPHFNTDCHPHSPKGPLMVSGEGACAAYYRYRRHQTDSNTEAQYEKG
ncbi:hydrogenase formation protein HypD [Alteromonas sp. CYL-A6]|uniref:hydrogenase formation protein HypD n=1 Tax=Alteromonas nitratireducens TaxID=3390813 RepID=UPI0034C099D9